MKFQFLEILKSCSIFEFFPNFWHASSISKYFQLVYSNMAPPKTTPSLISRGIRYPPPLAWDEIDTPLEIGLMMLSEGELAEHEYLD